MNLTKSDGLSISVCGFYGSYQDIEDVGDKHVFHVRASNLSRNFGVCVCVCVRLFIFVSCAFILRTGLTAETQISGDDGSDVMSLVAGLADLASVSFSSFSAWNDNTSLSYI